jgi:hypothetical protein
MIGYNETVSDLLTTLNIEKMKNTNKKSLTDDSIVKTILATKIIENKVH